MTAGAVVAAAIVQGGRAMGASTGALALLDDDGQAFLTVESTPGVGSAFTLVLPRA